MIIKRRVQGRMENGRQVFDIEEIHEWRWFRWVIRRTVRRTV